ncbi:DUF423 domain-containing protein [Flavobacteriales bacterium]|jgi:uncharacterized membrane protein YgdD (TMEM256/DUF423 family)|nr:DUF423 domain-containing protein [Flavobacteriales bacterium]
MTTENSIKIAILFCLSAVILGAFGAHALKEVLSESQLSSFQTGVRYQFFHGLAILILSFNMNYFTKRLSSIIKIMSAGIILFSFSIYLLNIQDLVGFSMSYLGPITPIGGLLLITSWIGLFFSIKK